MNGRNSILLKVFSIFTGLLFLNLSFILTEVKILELDQKNSALYENLVQMLSLTGFEEETDTTSGGANELQTDNHLFFQFITTPISGNPLLTTCATVQKSDSALLLCYREIFSPPPEV